MNVVKYSLQNLQPDRLLRYLAYGAFLVMPMGTSPFTIIGFCLFSVWIFSGEFMRKREAFLSANWLLPLTAVIIIVWLGLLWSSDPFSLGLTYAKKTYYWLYAFVFATMAFMGGLDGRLIKAFLLGLFLNALVGFLQLGHLFPTFSKTGILIYNGFYSGYNTLSILLVLGILMSSYSFRRAAEKRERLIYLFLMLAYFGHLMILGGRGGYLTFILLSPIIVHNIFPKRTIKGGVLTYAVIGVLLFSSPLVRDRVTEMATGLEQNIRSGRDAAFGKTYSGHVDRVYMWRYALELFIEHPILGVGTGGYRNAVLAEGGERSMDHPHSNLLYVAASFGSVGVILFAWFFWVLLRNGWRNRETPIGFFILASTLVILVGGLTDTHIVDAGAAFLLATTTGLQASLKRTVSRPCESIQGQV